MKTRLVLSLLAALAVFVATATRSKAACTEGQQLAANTYYHASRVNQLTNPPPPNTDIYVYYSIGSPKLSLWVLMTHLGGAPFYMFTQVLNAPLDNVLVCPNSDDWHAWLVTKQVNVRLGRATNKEYAAAHCANTALPAYILDQADDVTQTPELIVCTHAPGPFTAVFANPPGGVRVTPTANNGIVSSTFNGVTATWTRALGQKKAAYN